LEQKYLKKGGLIMLVTILGMTPPLSTDMYMPSLPSMAEYFKASTVLVNFTLVSFFLFMAIGMLFFGPLSDKYGRRKILVTALAIYCISSLACSASMNVWFMIIMRLAQGFGAGGMVSMSVAIIKDSFEGKTRATALAAVQSMSVIAPIAAPILGALVLKFSTWRTVFIILGVISALSLICSLFFQESLHEDEKVQGSIADSIRRLGLVGKNRNFTPFLIASSLCSAPLMAYLAVASYTYIDFFGLTETQFSLFFAVNAFVSVLGPVAYMRLNSVLSAKTTFSLLTLIGFISGILVFTAGSISPFLFLLCFLPYAIINSYTRPFSTNLLLDQFQGDTGSASALLNFVNTLFGSVGMLVGSLPWSSYVHGIAYTILVFTSISVIVWIAVLKSRKIRMKGIHISE